MTVFLKILIWANILSYNYPRLIGLSNSLLRKVATVLFPKKTCAQLIVSFPLIRRITIYSVVITRANFILSLVLSVYIRQHWFSNAQQRGLSISSPSRVLSRCLPWWLLWRQISLSCCFGIFSTQPVISSTWFGFCSWQGFTTFDLYDLSDSRLPSRGSYYKSYGFTSHINDLSSCFAFHKETASVSFWEALLPYCVF